METRNLNTLVASVEAGTFSKAKDVLDREKEPLSCLQTSNARKRLSIYCTPTFGMA